jgi:hypothetical protein
VYYFYYYYYYYIIILKYTTHPPVYYGGTGSINIIPVPVQQERNLVRHPYGIIIIGTTNTLNKLPRRRRRGKEEEEDD